MRSQTVGCSSSTAALDEACAGGTRASVILACRQWTTRFMSESCSSPAKCSSRLRSRFECIRLCGTVSSSCKQLPHKCPQGTGLVGVDSITFSAHPAKSSQAVF